jgi:hypothetical protein
MKQADQNQAFTSMAFAFELAQHGRKGRRQILCNQPAPHSCAGRPVHPHARRRGLECRHALRQEAGDDAGQHVARCGGAFELIAARPSGAAITVSGPFSTTIAPLRSAAARTVSSLEARSGKSRLNSP